MKKMKCDCKCDSTPTIDVIMKCTASGAVLGIISYYIYHLATAV